MGHLITVTEIDDEYEVTSLHVSGNEGANAIYRELGVPKLNQGNNGDGEAEIDRETIADASEALDWQGHIAQSNFLREVLQSSSSPSFHFNFS